MRLKRTVLLVLLLLFSSMVIFGREVKVGYYRYGDYHLRSKDGVYSGFGYELYELLAKTAGWTNRYVGVNRPCEDMAKMIASGEIEILDCVRKTPEREKIYEYSALPSGYCCGYMIVRADEARYAERDYANWGRVRVGFIAGGSIGADFEKFAALHGIELEKVEFRDENAIPKALRAGLLDMAIVHSTFYGGSKDFKRVGEFSLKPCYFCVKKGNKTLMAEIDRAMAKMYEENPAWYVDLRRKCLSGQEVVIYLPRDDDDVHRRYVRAVACLLSAIGSMNPVFRECAEDFSDADLSIPCIVAHVHRTPENLKKFDFPLVSACRRPLHLVCDSADTRFANGIPKDVGTLKIGYDRTEPEWLRCFKDYAAHRNIAYTLVPFDSIEGLRRAACTRKVDLAVLGIDPKGELKRIADCGSVEFDFATPKRQPAFRQMNDMATRYMRYHERTFIRRLEQYAYGITDVSRVVRAGVYAESGAIDIAEDGRISGFIADYLREVAYRKNWDLIFVPMTYSETRECLATGEIDVAPTSSCALEDSTLFDRTRRDTGVLRYSLRVKADSMLLPNRPDLWTGNRIGYLAGSRTVDELKRYLDGIGAKYRLVPYTRIQNAFVDIRRGRLEGFYTLHASESRDYRTLAVFPAVHSYFCISRQRSDVKRDLDDVMDYFASNNIDFNWWLGNVYLRGSRDVLMLDPDEIAYIGRTRGRKIVVGFPEAVDPILRFDEKTGRASGLLAALFRTIAARAGFEIEFTGKGRADVYVTQHESLEGRREPVQGSEWFPLPTAQVSLPDDRIPEAARGIWAAEAKRVDEIEYLRQCNYKVLVCDSREDCYRAVAEGRAEATIDNSGTARLMIDEHREFEELRGTRIDPARWSRQASLVFSPEAAPELRSILVKSRMAISSSEAEKMLVDAIVECRQDRFSRADLVLYGVVTGLLVVILLGAGYVFMYVRRQQEMAKARTKFFFNVSHDVRTPVHAIMGLIDMSLSDLDDRNKVKDHLIKAKGAGGLLLSLIKSVLDMSRIEANKVKHEENYGDLYLSFVEIEPAMRELAEEKKIRLTFDFGEIRDRYVYVDYELTARIFVNIIANAIKYTNEGGRVDVKCEQIPVQSSKSEVQGSEASGVEHQPSDKIAWYRYVFSDNGIGMSEKFLKHLYDKFSREKSTTMSGVGGLGLGMSIVKSFVDRLGGRIECQSKVGVGTTFTVTLPYRVQKGRKWIDPLTGAVRDKNVERCGASPAVPPRRSAADFSGMTALLVDDSKLNREVACHYLKKAGFEVETAENGLKAVEMVKLRRYDVVLMDLQMPVMDGDEATRQIRAWEAESRAGDASSVSRHIPIIAWTANAFDEDIAAALEAGMDGHIAKGIKSNAMRETLARFVKRGNA